MSAPFEDIAKKSIQNVSTSQGVPFWGDAPESWETVVVAGYSLPGICSLDGKVTRRHDKKKSPGVNGATLTYISDDQAAFTVTVRMWTPEHLATYEKVIGFIRNMVLASSEAKKNTLSQSEKIIDKRQKERNQYSKFPIAPVDIVHPVLTLHRIKAAHVIEYGFPKAKGDPAEGIYEATIHFLEYVPGSKGSVVTPKSALNLETRYGKGALGDQLAKSKPSTVNGAKP